MDIASDIGESRLKLNLQLFASNKAIVVNNMKEFFETSFGKEIKNSVQKSPKLYDGKSIYRVTKDSKFFNKGDQFYLDALHKDHLEVFNRHGIFKEVLNLDGTANELKTQKGMGRRIPK